MWIGGRCWIWGIHGIAYWEIGTGDALFWSCDLAESKSIFLSPRRAGRDGKVTLRLARGGGETERTNMKIVNFTPHAVTIRRGETGDRMIPPSGKVARVSQVLAEAGTLDGIRLVRSTYGPVTGLPESEAGTAYIVSTMVRLAVPGRSDVYSPVDFVRDAAGQIVACKGLEENA